MKDFFTQNMDQLMVNLVLPHVGVTKQTLALFSEEIGVYIDYYFRNTELQTRRAAALELMRVICRNYHTFEPFLTTQISNYLQMVDKNINSQCTILNLIIDGCCKGFRDVDGCTSLFVSEQIVLVAYKSIVKPALAEFYEWILNNPNQAV